MKRSNFLALLSFVFLTLTVGRAVAAAPEAVHRCYELRIYHAAEGKLDALHARFRDHTTGLFTRHGMTNVGYWVPVENPGNQLIYLLSYPDETARELSWKGFLADPEWIAVKTASETSGSLVAKIENRILAQTDFSPAMKVDPVGAPHAFEIRTYTASPGNLKNLLARFRNHTVGLFSKHGMHHFGYFTPATGQPGADDTLIYFLAHASTEAHATSFDAFRVDPVWVQAKTESETAAGGSLTAQNGVISELLKATDYSPVK
ncbi:MAG: NIPSNAP family protein [Akkermansiaceae bacterium]